MTKGRLLGAIAACGIAALVSHSASAASILVDQGDNTYDPSTHLKWLDLTLTANQSYSAVIAGYGNYTTTGGYHFATSTELAQLFTDAGGSGTYPQSEDSTTSSHPTYDLTLALLQLLGINSTFTPNPNIDFRDSQGFLADNFAGFPYYGTLQAHLQFGEYTTKLTAKSSSPTTGNASSAVGSFLVKSVPVSQTPLPSALLLFISALGGLGLTAWRRKPAA